MCRWLAYSGDPILLRELILNPRHSLIDQSLSAHSARRTTNGDGFGVGWYGTGAEPGLYKHVQPAWSDPNLRDLCHQVHSPMFLAHVRAATQTSTQYSNCHPFRHGRWLFVHNGVVFSFAEIRRELMLGIQPEYFRFLEGTTDSEILFYLALGFGLDADPQGALERMAGFVEEIGRAHGIEKVVDMTLGLADGERIYAVRYASAGTPNTLYHSRRVSALRELVPPEEEERLSLFSDDARAIVSEPLSELSDVWAEIDESTFLVLEAGELDRRRFRPARTSPS